jgi:hypothetical protein
MSEQRTDHAAETATTTHADEGEGQGLVAPGASTEPGSGAGDDTDVPATEGQRQLVETVKQIHRLEESN